MKVKKPLRSKWQLKDIHRLDIRMSHSANEKNFPLTRFSLNADSILKPRRALAAMHHLVWWEMGSTNKNSWRMFCVAFVNGSKMCMWAFSGWRQGCGALSRASVISIKSIICFLIWINLFACSLGGILWPGTVDVGLAVYFYNSFVPRELLWTSVRHGFFSLLIESPKFK